MQLHKLQLDLEQQHPVLTSNTLTKWQIKTTQVQIPLQTKNTYRKVMYKIHSQVLWDRLKLQNLTRAQPESVGTSTNNSTPTCNTTIFYPGEVPFRNQGTSTSPIIMETTRNLPQQQTIGKGGKKKEFLKRSS